MLKKVGTIEKRHADNQSLNVGLSKPTQVNLKWFPGSLEAWLHNCSHQNTQIRSGHPLGVTETGIWHPGRQRSLCLRSPLFSPPRCVNGYRLQDTYLEWVTPLIALCFEFPQNNPFWSFVSSALAFDCKRGWSWCWFVTKFPAFHMHENNVQIMLCFCLQPFDQHHLRMKSNSNLSSTQRPKPWAHKCKMGYLGGTAKYSHFSMSVPFSFLLMDLFLLCPADFPFT